MKLSKNEEVMAPLGPHTGPPLLIGQFYLHLYRPI